MIEPEILKKSRYGLAIYQLVMREVYPGEELIEPTGMDVKSVKNPFNNHRKTLTIYKDGDRYMFMDSENMCLKGDPFEFAHLHYKITGIPLYQLLDKKLDLKIDKDHFSTKKGKNQRKQTEDPQLELPDNARENEFSFFKAPISNIVPFKNMTLAEAYDLIRSDAYRHTTEKLRSQKSVKEGRNFKPWNFDYVTFSGVFTTRKNDSLARYSGLLTVDFDHLPDVEGIKKKLINDPCLDTQLLFVSPSGDGLKWIISANLSGLSHSEFFTAVEIYIKEKYDIAIDDSGKDVARACFLPYDPEAYINPNVLDGTLPTKKFDARKWLKKLRKNDVIKPPTILNSMNTTQKVEIVIRRIEESNTDITYTYADWRDIGFAIASEFKESGRDYFHRVSRFNGGYDYTACNKQYDRCMKSNKEKISIATFFHFAKEGGIDISYQEKRQYNPIPQRESKRKQNETDKESCAEPPVNEDESIEFETTTHPFRNTPRIPDSVHSQLPLVLRECCDMFEESVEKDIILLGALTVISGCLPNLQGKYFRKLYSPHLYSFVTAPAGSGKGILDWASYLGNSIHQKMVKQSMIAKAEYERELAEYNNLSKSQRNETPPPIEPIRRKLFVPANCSSSAFIQAMADNDFRIMIFETEADTLASTLKQEWGNFCDVLRKAFHHEKASMFRRKDNEFIEIYNPQLAIMLAGTPKQVVNIMPNVENGLFSRFLYYAFEHHSKFKNPFVDNDDEDLTIFFKKKGDTIMQLYEIFKGLSYPVRFMLTPKQEEHFTQVFEELYDRNRLLLNSDFNANSLRLGLITFRIAMVLTALRVLEDGLIGNQMECSDTDFETAIQIVFTLEKHSVAVFQNLPEYQENSIKMTYFKSLPVEFNYLQAIAIANGLDIKERTAINYLKEMKAGGLLVHKQRWYSKASNNGTTVEAASVKGNADDSKKAEP